MGNRDDLDKFHKEISSTILKSDDNEFAKYFNNSFLAGDNTIYQKNISETKKFDMEWIQTVESYFPSIDKITRDPKSNLKYEEEVVAVEKARKINANSVKHLASHTHLIKEIDENLNVTPKKVQVSFAEQDYAIYENRFIATLIRRLFLFVRNRYEVIKSNVESFQRDHLNATSKFEFNGTDVDMSIDIVIKKDLDDRSINEHNQELLARVTKLNTLITGLNNCQFMKLLAGAPAVHPPIMKTNIIMHNPDFRNAYNLWIFLDRYSALAYDVEVREKDLSFDDSFKKDLEGLFLINYATIIANQNERAEIYNAPEGYETLVKKRTKVAKKNAKDFVDNPDMIQIEDGAINEYFLAKYQSLFDKATTGFIRDEYEGVTDFEIKKALRQTIEILNGLYEAKFNFTDEEADDAIFRRLVKDEDIEKSYNTKKEQLRYADMIRDAKRVDYNNSIRIERKIIKDLERINRKYIQDALDKRKLEQDEAKLKALQDIIDTKRKENEELEQRLKEIDDYTKLTKEEEEKIALERELANNRYNLALKEFDAKMKQKFLEEKEKLLKQLEEEKAHNRVLKQALTEAIRRRKEEIQNRIKDERAKSKAKFEEEKKDLLQKIDLERLELLGLLEKMRHDFDVEQRMAKENEEQRIKEELAKYKVSKYEERLIERSEIDRISSQFEEEKTSESSRIFRIFGQEVREKLAIKKVKEHEVLEQAKDQAEKDILKYEKEEEELKQARIREQKEKELKEQKDRETKAINKVGKYEEKQAKKKQNKKK